ncbi:Glycosyl hydrolases family 43 [Botrimarina colliarenosi]|uniref:Glycosyl hydrolases family 43 n=1 Tax=Botrimarina colliarenosi TaxID=2528001 RepID=A0A5C6AE24_9BACT|nr:glycosylase [Botrimarina colliarenosi]TWT97670.1 Glycosyl hydrolases family 43 [Botrimarina colliarenosi]
MIRSLFIACSLLIVTPVLAEGLLAEEAVIDDATMQRVYDELQTPHKVGRVLTPGEGEYYDCPNVFRHNGRWWMVFVSIKELVGYETRLAVSDDLLHWEVVGTTLGFREEGWDRWQADGSIALMDPAWGGSYELSQHDGKYWMSYFGGDKQGYETDPLSIGMAWSEDPTHAGEWNRLVENPVMRPGDDDARDFERATLYKSHIFRDPAESLGAPFVMFYNGKQKGGWVERIGVAVSDDLVHWRRDGEGPVIDNGKGISGDPQLIRMDDLWVMPYFGAGWKPRAFDTFAVSRDLMHWTKWEGPHLIEPTEAFDETFAHKPWMIKHNGVVYHFYCSVGEGVRAIALATSEELSAK